MGATDEMAAVWGGLSMYDALGAARYTARKRPFLGALIAELALPTDRFRIEKTTSHPRHYTVWGEPELFPRYVIAVWPVW